MSLFLYHVSRLVSQHTWIDPYLICRSDDPTAQPISLPPTMAGMESLPRSIRPFLTKSNTHALMNCCARWISPRHYSGCSYMKN
jgi:hypothetical protein